MHAQISFYFDTKLLKRIQGASVILDMVIKIKWRLTKMRLFAN